MSGEGTINLPARTLNLRVNPQIVASLEGQGGKTDLQGLGVPVVISGPWASPRIYPDIKGILENPVAAYEQLNKLGGGLVKLPSLDELGEKAGVSGVPLSNIVKDGKINRDALQQGAVEGLEQLMNKQTKQKPPPSHRPSRLPRPLRRQQCLPRPRLRRTNQWRPNRQRNLHHRLSPPRQSPRSRPPKRHKRRPSRRSSGSRSGSARPRMRPSNSCKICSAISRLYAGKRNLTEERK